ncbi:AraC family transcriptional regulator [Actinobacteria bacterium YIM 96077]|uniref:AraC family transcriptional regulator n=1 Tax=Phytoactinopolyspora halophila TaxID=1981511 RepID=A0A329QGL5_9ACTN|nr:AraC family transcriptional regulator [Phytoactinopolyspora halophila]AYY13079.1 AraC family transcriptional regulator [Actinobacteria bacterium YIM 96077]RAW11091.1 AraC family transcriptional regulator [Phytoactinopolyspora halophila]
MSTLSYKAVSSSLKESSTESGHDLLSELLAPLRLQGVFHSRWSVRAPWGIAGEGEDCALVHYVHQGRCVVEMPDGAEPVELRAGDLAVFPHGTAHRLGDRPGRNTVPLASLLPHRPPGSTRTVQVDGPGSLTTMLCGGLHYEAASAAPLYQALPAVFVLDAAALRSQPLLADTLARLADDWTDDEPGAQLVALRAFELAFVLALRTGLSALGSHEPVLRALRHPSISKALLAIHTRFGEPWTLESLAAEAGLSRSAFAATFRDLVGQAPMAHLAARRLQEAARLLVETARPHERIAERVGYRSGVGFHLAFRNHYGQTPGEYRRTRR